MNNRTAIVYEPDFIFWLTRVIGSENLPYRARAILKLARKWNFDPHRIFQAAEADWKSANPGQAVLDYDLIAPDGSDVTHQDYAISEMFDDASFNIKPGEWHWEMGLPDDSPPYWILAERPNSE